MTKSELINDLKKVTGSSFVTRNQLAAWMGKTPQYIDRYLVGLERIGKRYFIPDVIEVLEKVVTVK